MTDCDCDDCGDCALHSEMRKVDRALDDLRADNTRLVERVGALEKSLAHAYSLFKHYQPKELVMK